MKRRYIIGYSLLLLMGCARIIENLSKSTLSRKSKNVEKLRLTVTDVSKLEQLKKDYQTFTAVLSQVLSIPIELLAVNNIVETAPVLLTSQLDLALCGPSDYLILRARAKAIPIVSITRLNYHTVVSVRADSGITSLEQLKGKRIGIRSYGATASHLGTAQVFVNARLNFPSDFTIVIVKDDGLQKLLAGDIDAWGDSHHNREKLMEKVDLPPQEIKVLAQGKPLPNDVFVASPNLDYQLIAQIRRQMLNNESQLIKAISNTPNNRKYQHSQLVMTNNSDYDQLREIYEHLGHKTVIE